MANVIYRGPVSCEPLTINKQVKTGLLPGVAVVIAAGLFESAAAGGKGRLMVLGNMAFAGQAVDAPYSANDTGAAFRLEPEQEYQVLSPAGKTLVHGDPLTTDSNGKWIKATAGKIIRAWYDGKGETTSGDTLIDVVIASPEVQA